jgi:hypothetical protein
MRLAHIKPVSYVDTNVHTVDNVDMKLEGPEEYIKLVGAGEGRRRVEGGREDVRSAAGVRDWVDIVESGGLVGAREAPVDGGEEGALEAGKFGGPDAPDACVGAERVAV